MEKSQGCPLGHSSASEEGVVMSTNWDYLRVMKMNEMAPAPNMAPVTKLDATIESQRFAPWFWPDEQLSDVLDFRKSAFLDDTCRVLDTGDDDPVVRAASQQLLFLQANYLAKYFPDKYRIETQRKFGKVIINTVTDDQFSVRPEGDDWHPLAISGLLGQEDICVVKRDEEGKHVLRAGFLATPTNWNLSDFVGADMDRIHHNVDGYHEPAGTNRYRLKDTVDKFLDHLHEYPSGITWRGNQFVEYTPNIALEPSLERNLRPKKIARDIGSRLFLRSERETLTRLPAPYDDFTIFTIKPHVFRMEDVRRERGDDFVRALATNSVLRSTLKSTENRKINLQSMLEQYLLEKED